MSWAEAKMLSDVVVDSTRFSEIVNKEAHLTDGQNVTVIGSGKAYVKTVIGNGWTEFYVDGKYINPDVLPYDSMSTTRYPAIDFSESFSVVLRTNASASGTIAIVAFLRDNISIGGGYRPKLVPFFSRKAVAA